MARGARLRIASFFLLFSFLRFVVFSSPNKISSDQNDVFLRSPGPSMVLPLFLSTQNSSRLSHKGGFHRQLQKVDDHLSNARMRLHDDLLSNGYYTTRLWIGTPPQEFALIVDSGSTVTYVPCSTCEQCGKHQDPQFQPDLSSTYKPVRCNIDCNCNRERSQCIYERQYAEMSSSSGVLGEDIISFGNGSALKPQHAVFGCENVETGDLYSQHADGIMGLGRGQLSIMDQLVEKGVISDSFSLCYGGMDFGGGAMVLGGISPPSGMVFSHSDPARSPYYNIELKELRVAGKSLKLNPSVFDGKHGTVLDSGTTYAYLPEAAFQAFKDAVMENLSHLRQIRGPDPNYNDICFSGAGSDISELSKTFPEVEMVFGTGQKLLLAPENYLFRHLKVRGAYCLGIFQNGKDPTTLLGGIIVRNTLVTYDRENEKIGFYKTNCSDLWEKIHVPGAPPPVASAPNLTTGLPPTMAPNNMQDYEIPDELEVGLITFDMSLSIKYSDLAPHITELSKFIAHELEVNTSQVHLLNFTGKSNESLIRWAIFPAGSAKYLSNNTAMSIIVRLTQHRLQLPSNFGSYELVEWKIEPPMKRTWWKQHFVVVIIGVAISFILGFATCGIWFVLRQRRAAFAAYKPVDAAVPEQELQQL